MTEAVGRSNRIGGTVRWTCLTFAEVARLEQGYLGYPVTAWLP